MATVKVLVLRTAGTNCDGETAFAFEQAGAKAEMVHINRILESPEKLDAYQILAIPGGFSYGDDISAGKIFAVRLLHDLGRRLGDFVNRDRLVLGICNGFQVLVKAGLLPEVKPSEDFQQEVTLSDNDSGKFEDRWVWLKSYSDRCVFIEPDRMIYLPIAHAEGKFIPKSEAVLERLKANGQIVFRYVDNKGQFGSYPISPNGSVDHVAGICDPSGRVLGLMPHPERHVKRTHHPHWTRLGEAHEGDGRVIFDRAVRYFA
ncbi:MAG: phosphoribosylformylglycinamidine synthase I [Phycisphaerae bacterium]|nr:phosphoribosylformylglycinamidine synthase I [Phycisphaerae bacterium]